MFRLKGLKEKPKLLTIAIPTYNRATHLDQCLGQICPQVKGREELVDILVSDNCSSDNTMEVIEKYVKNGFDITYLRSDKNKGMDINFLKCFNEANSKYVWVFGDDDVLLDDGLRKVIEVLLSGDYGIVYLHSYTYIGKLFGEAIKPKSQAIGYNVYYSKKAFIRFEHYMIAHITGNIINKSLVNTDIDLSPFVGGYLILVALGLSAFSNSTQNVYIKDIIWGYKPDNGGGYAACKVFGPNFEKILQYFYGKGFDYGDFEAIKRMLVCNLFPAIIRLARTGKRSAFKAEDYYKTLYPVFRKYVGFWVFTYPMIKLPVNLLFIPYTIMRVCNRFLRLIDSVYVKFNILIGNIKTYKYKNK